MKLLTEKEKWKMEHLLKSLDWHKTYIEIAKLIAQHSKAEKRKVGAIIVKAGRIISTGYNGTVPGADNTCEINSVTKPDVLHAETNAILKCARSAETTEGATIYVTLSPCITCATFIIQAGIKQVAYWDFWHKGHDAITLLVNAGVDCFQVI